MSFSVEQFFSAEYGGTPSQLLADLCSIVARDTVNAQLRKVEVLLILRHGAAEPWETVSALLYARYHKKLKHSGKQPPIYVQIRKAFVGATKSIARWQRDISQLAVISHDTATVYSGWERMLGVVARHLTYSPYINYLRIEEDLKLFFVAPAEAVFPYLAVDSNAIEIPPLSESL